MKIPHLIGPALGVMALALAAGGAVRPLRHRPDPWQCRLGKMSRRAGGPACRLTVKFATPLQPRWGPTSRSAEEVGESSPASARRSLAA
jgi:hypothetical protein